MKGVILAGGLGTRLKPLTLVTNKHLLPVYNLPMVFYPIKTLVGAGINEIMLVTGGPHAGHFLSVIKNGKELGIKHLEYAYQESEGGIADALRLAKDFSDGGPMCVILGDNCTDTDIKQEVEKFESGAHIFLKEVSDPQRFGVPTFDKNKKIVRIDEKPEKPGSNYAITGLYLYDNTVFDKIRSIKPSSRGELEISEVNQKYLEEGTLSWSDMKGFWKDAGTFDTLYEVNKFWADKIRLNS